MVVFRSAPALTFRILIRKRTSFTALIVFCYATFGSAAAASCIDKVTDYASASSCIKLEIEPLNGKIEELDKSLALRFTGTEVMMSLDLSKRGWLAYFNAQCTAEVTALILRGVAKDSPEIWRNQLKCAKRISEARIKELQGL